MRERNAGAGSVKKKKIVNEDELNFMSPLEALELAFEQQKMDAYNKEQESRKSTASKPASSRTKTTPKPTPKPTPGPQDAQPKSTGKTTKSAPKPTPTPAISQAKNTLEDKKAGSKATNPVGYQGPKSYMKPRTGTTAKPLADKDRSTSTSSQTKGARTISPNELSMIAQRAAINFSEAYKGIDFGSRKRTETSGNRRAVSTKAPASSQARYTLGDKKAGSKATSTVGYQGPKSYMKPRTGTTAKPLADKDRSTSTSSQTKNARTISPNELSMIAQRAAINFSEAYKGIDFGSRKRTETSGNRRAVSTKAPASSQARYTLDDKKAGSKATNPIGYLGPKSYMKPRTGTTAKPFATQSSSVSNAASTVSQKQIGYQGPKSYMKPRTGTTAKPLAVQSSATSASTSQKKTEPQSSKPYSTSPTKSSGTRTGASDTAAKIRQGFIGNATTSNKTSKTYSMPTKEEQERLRKENAAKAAAAASKKYGGR